jgi:hypothetical protein
MAASELDPWGETRMDARFAMMTASILNRLRWTDDSPIVKALDLMPDFLGIKEEYKARQTGEPMTPEEYRARQRGE